MATRTIKLGREAVLYRGTAGGAASTIVPNVGDLTLTLDSISADATTRDCGGWDDEMVTHKKLSLTFTLSADEATGEAKNAWTAFKDAYINGTLLALHVKSHTGGSGPLGDFTITKFDRGENVKDVQLYSVEAKHSIAHRIPTWS